MRRHPSLPKPERRDHLEVCYVCAHKITGNPVYIGKALYRHQRCEPGSARWQQSERGKASDMAQYFPKAEGGE